MIDSVRAIEPQIWGPCFPGGLGCVLPATPHLGLQPG